MNEKQIAADMSSAYQQQAAFEYMLSREIRERGFNDTASKLQKKASFYAWRSRRYLDWVRNEQL